MTDLKVSVSRTETFPGEYANVTVTVEETVDESRGVQEALERAEQQVATRLRFLRERRTRRGPWWADQVVGGPLERFDQEGSA